MSVSRENVLLVFDGPTVIKKIYQTQARASSGVVDVGEVVRTCMRSFRRGITEHNPTHMVVAFDVEGATFRNDLLPSYKSGRQPHSKQYLEVVQRCSDALSEMGCFVASASGYESADVVATVAQKGVDAGARVVVCSRDKGLYVLLDLGVEIYRHFDKEWIDAARVVEHLGVEPWKVPMLLSLVGGVDSGLSGVEGVGIKTAAKWLQECGTIAGVIDAVKSGKYTGKVAQNLMAAQGSVFLSLQLAALAMDVDVGIRRWGQMKLHEASQAAGQDGWCSSGAADLGDQGYVEDPGYLRSLYESCPG